MGLLTQAIENMRTGVACLRERVDDTPQLDIELSRMLLMTGTVLGGQFEEALRPHGLVDSEFRTLIMLFASPDGRAHPGDLCEFATQTPANMTRIVDTLVQQGWVTRTPSELDRRRVVLQITAAGQRFVRKLLPGLFAQLRHKFTGFSVQEKRQLRRLLAKLIANIDSPHPPQDP